MVHHFRDKNIHRREGVCDVEQSGSNPPAGPVQIRLGNGHKEHRCSYREFSFWSKDLDLISIPPSLRSAQLWGNPTAIVFLIRHRIRSRNLYRKLQAIDGLVDRDFKRADTASDPDLIFLGLSIFFMFRSDWSRSDLWSIPCSFILFFEVGNDLDLIWCWHGCLLIPIWIGFRRSDICDLTS